MKRSTLTGATKRVDFECVGEDCWAEYRVAFATPAFHARFSKITGVEDLVDEIPALVCSLVSGWDLVDDDDQPVPVTVDVVADLPYEYLQPMLGAIWGDQSVDPSKGATSAGG